MSATGVVIGQGPTHLDRRSAGRRRSEPAGRRWRDLRQADSGP